MAVGIGLDEIKESVEDKKYQVLIYFKERDEALLKKAIDISTRLGYSFRLIYYGKYKQQDYLEAIKESRFAIWIGRQESQGIALQEAMATGLPLIVVDANSLFDTIYDDKQGYVGYDLKLSLIKTSSAPYFDERCGIKINSIDELENAIAKIEAGYTEFKPREFVESELSLGGRSEELLSLTCI